MKFTKPREREASALYCPAMNSSSPTYFFFVHFFLSSLIRSDKSEERKSKAKKKKKKKNGEKNKWPFSSSFIMTIVTRIALHLDTYFG
jgi:hypothetical protein